MLISIELVLLLFDALLATLKGMERSWLWNQFTDTCYSGTQRWGGLLEIRDFLPFGIRFMRHGGMIQLCL